MMSTLSSRGDLVNDNVIRSFRIRNQLLFQNVFSSVSNWLLLRAAAPGGAAFANGKRALVERRYALAVEWGMFLASVRYHDLQLLRPGEARAAAGAIGRDGAIAFAELARAEHEGALWRRVESPGGPAGLAELLLLHPAGGAGGAAGSAGAVASAAPAGGKQRSGAPNNAGQSPLTDDSDDDLFEARVGRCLWLRSPNVFQRGEFAGGFFGPETKHQLERKSVGRSCAGLRRLRVQNAKFDRCVPHSGEGADVTSRPFHTPPTTAVTANPNHTSKWTPTTN